MGRRLTTGRFDTRQELLEFVWREYTNTSRSVAQVARAARISEATAHKILNNFRGRGLTTTDDAGILLARKQQEGA